MTKEEIIMKLSERCPDLPDDLLKEVRKVQKEAEEKAQRMLADKMRADALVEKERKRKKAEENSLRKELLCIGSWGEKVPLERRFALCESTGKRRNDPSKDFEDVTEYCAIDLVRGYMSPYWGYYMYWGEPSASYCNRVRPIIDAKTESDRIHFIQGEWNFFEASHDARKFRVLEYTVKDLNCNDTYGTPKFEVTITGRSPLRTFKEHQDLLRKEFE